MFFLCACVCAGTVRRSLWSYQKMSVMSWWRKRAAVCSRPDTVSATLHARRRPLRSTWTAALRKTRDKTDGLEHISLFFWHLLAAAAQKPGHATLNLSVKPDRYLNIRQNCRALTLQFEPLDWLRNPTVHYSVCTVKFKGMYEGYSIQKKRINIV